MLWAMGYQDTVDVEPPLIEQSREHQVPAFLGQFHLGTVPAKPGRRMIVFGKNSLSL